MDIEEEEEIDLKKKKLKAIEIERESDAKDFENFMDELEQNKYMRSKINLYVDDESKKISENIPEEPDEEMVQLKELMNDLEIPKKKKELTIKQQLSEADQEIEDFIKELEQVKVHKN